MTLCKYHDYYFVPDRFVWTSATWLRSPNILQKCCRSALPFLPAFLSDRLGQDERGCVYVLWVTRKYRQGAAGNGWALLGDVKLVSQC